MRGYFGIGIEGSKTPLNVGTLWRSAYTFGAAFIFTIGRRYPSQASDTLKSWRHIPLYNYESLEEFWRALPYDCPVIGVEQAPQSKSLEVFTHPQRAVYVLGAEDRGLSKSAASRCHTLVQIDSRFCLNVAVAGSIVMYHRVTQQRQGAA